MSNLKKFKNPNALIRTGNINPAKIGALMRNDGVVIDIKSAIDPKVIPGNLRYWSL